MPRKTPILNLRAQLKTWHFASVLTSTHEICANIYWLATNKINVAHAHNLLVKACIREKVENDSRPLAFLTCGCYVVDLKCEGKTRTPIAGSAFRRIHPFNWCHWSLSTGHTTSIIASPVLPFDMVQCKLWSFRDFIPIAHDSNCRILRFDVYAILLYRTS